MPKVICFYSLVVCSEKYPNFLLRTFLIEKRERSHWKSNFWNGAARYSIAFRLKVEIDLIVSSECFCSHIGTPTSYFFLTFMFKYELLLSIYFCWIPNCHKTLDFPFHWIRGESWVKEIVFFLYFTKNMLFTRSYTLHQKSHIYICICWNSPLNFLFNK